MVRIAMPIGTTAAASLAAGPAIAAGAATAIDNYASSSFATGGDAPTDVSPLHHHPFAMPSRRQYSWAMPLASLAIAASALLATGAIDNAVVGAESPALALGIWGAWTLEGLRRRFLGQDRWDDYMQEHSFVQDRAAHMSSEDRRAFLAAARGRVLSVSNQPVAHSDVYVVEHTTANVFGGRDDWGWQYQFSGSGQTTYMLVDRSFNGTGQAMRLSDRPNGLQMSPDDARRLMEVLDDQRSPQFFAHQNQGGFVTHFAAAEVPGSAKAFRLAMADFRLQQARFDAAISDLQVLISKFHPLDKEGVVGEETGTSIYLIRAYGSDGDYDVGLQETVMMVDLAAERGVRYTFGQDEILRQDVKGIWMTREDVQRWDRALDRETDPSAAASYLGWAAIELPEGHPSLNAIKRLERIRQDFDDTHRAVTAALEDFLTTMPSNPFRHVPFNPPPGF